MQFGEGGGLQKLLRGFAVKRDRPSAVLAFCLEVQIQRDDLLQQCGVVREALMDLICFSVFRDHGPVRVVERNALDLHIGDLVAVHRFSL